MSEPYVVKKAPCTLRTCKIYVAQMDHMHAFKGTAHMAHILCRVLVDMQFPDELARAAFDPIMCTAPSCFVYTVDMVCVLRC